jgi:hypothetical protein
MKHAILRIGPQALATLLQLPAGAEVTGVAHDVMKRGELLIRIQGAGWEVEPGCHIPQATGTITTTHDDTGAVVKTDIDWQFPA